MMGMASLPIDGAAAFESSIRELFDGTMPLVAFAND